MFKSIPSITKVSPQPGFLKDIFSFTVSFLTKIYLSPYTISNRSIVFDRIVISAKKRCALSWFYTYLPRSLSFFRIFPYLNPTLILRRSAGNSDINFISQSPTSQKHKMRNKVLHCNIFLIVYCEKF